MEIYTIFILYKFGLKCISSRKMEIYLYLIYKFCIKDNEHGYLCLIYKICIKDNEHAYI